MSIKSSLGLVWAKKQKKTVEEQAKRAVEHQDQILKSLLHLAQETAFGKEHKFSSLSSYTDFREAVAIRGYEDIKPYIERTIAGEKNVLWRGLPLYLSKTSGTTSGVKYIPLTKESLPNHIDTARNALLCYIANSGNASVLDGKMIFLSGSPKLDKKGTIPTGRLSGIVHNHVPAYLLKNRLPSYEVNCIATWEEKLEKIVEESYTADLRLMSGIPPWVQMYVDKLTEKTGKTIHDIFPNLSLFMHGGVNIHPYIQQLDKSIGKKIDFIETFPASEGFFAYQDTLDPTLGMLLNTNSGIYFEFIPLEDIGKPSPKRLPLNQVEKNKTYALIINNNAGLWAYDIGDLVAFTSVHPYRVIVKGRTKHFISAFGEHVIAEEVESSLAEIAHRTGAEIREFTVAPYIDQEKSVHSRHEWYIEFEKAPTDLTAMENELDRLMRKKNLYYDDLRKGGIIAMLKVFSVPKDTFLHYMKSVGKLGEQNKVVRLSNDRQVVDHPAFTAYKP